MWTSALTKLRPSLTPQHAAWLGLARPIGLLESTCVIGVPNDFAREVDRAQHRRTPRRDAVRAS